MLASIHPLGERARQNSWGLTVALYFIGAAVGGAGLGAVLGAAGQLAALNADVRLSVLALLCIAAGTADALRWRLPTRRRQVNEDWLVRYRGWVYGIGFGWQLGLGLATIVTTATVYLWLAAAWLSASVSAGAAIGLAFGVARALPTLAVSRVRGPASLRQVHAALARWAGPARIGTAAVTAGLAVLSAGALRP